MAGTLNIDKISDTVGADLQRRIKESPGLPLEIGEKMAQTFKVMARRQYLSGSGRDSLGRMTGRTYIDSFYYRNSSTRKFAKFKLTNRMANLFEKYKARPRVKFLTATARTFRQRNIGARILEQEVKKVTNGAARV